jgi:hypothetical protein
LTWKINRLKSKTWIESTSFATSLSTEIVGNYIGGLIRFFAVGKHIAPHAEFLRMEKFPLRIKGISVWKLSCAHFYPQKVCRTVLAATPATRYIAQSRMSCRFT